MIANNSNAPVKQLIKPPHSEQAEAAVIGAILSHGKTDQRVREIFDTLNPDMFYFQTTRHIYQTAARLKECDLITITDALDKSGYFDSHGIGFAEVAQYSRADFLINNLNKYAQTIKQEYVKRHLMSVANNIIQQAASDASPDEIVEYANDQLTSVDLGTDYNPSYIADMLEPWLENLQARASKDPNVTGVPTGIKQIDKFITGIGKTWLVILAGRPSHGKSLVAQIIGNYISQFNAVLSMSMEMTETEIMDRNFGLMANLTPTELREGLVEGEKYTRLVKATSQIKEDKFKLYYDETPSLSVEQVCARAKAFKRKNPELGLIQVDYLGLMETPKADRNDLGVGKITKRLKQLAKEIDVPVMLLAQLNRESDTQSRPQMRNLADSASIERDADLVMFVHNPEVQNPDCDSCEKGIIEILCGKFRHGQQFKGAAIRNSDGDHSELSINELAELQNARGQGNKHSKGGFNL